MLHITRKQIEQGEKRGLSYQQIKTAAKLISSELEDGGFSDSYSKAVILFYFNKILDKVERGDKGYRAQLFVISCYYNNFLNDIK